VPELTGTKDLGSYARMFWRWKWLFLCCVIACPTIAYLISRSQPSVYKSSALLGINDATVNASVVNGSGSFTTSNIAAIARLVTTTPVADIAAGLLSPPANPGEVVGEVSATGDPATNFLTVSAEDRSPVRAAAIANAFARAISLNLERSALRQIDTTIKDLQAQLAHTGRTDQATRLQLQQQISQLEIARSTQGGQAAILQAAAPSGTPAGGGTRRAVELGLLIGLLLGVAAVVLAESADRRLHTPDDLESETELPVLAAIESSAFSGDLDTGKEDAEAFQMLRTALMYFTVDRRLDSVLITSAGEKEGKTTVATRLALTTASAGLTVVLLDADLRRGQVGARLGIQAEDGLGAVIAGSRTLSEVAVDFPLDPPATGRLQVVPAGRPPPNPSALMSSERLQRILEELEARCDLLIIDTPAALAVSDPVPLMRKVSGVVVVARINRSSRYTIRRLKKVVEAAHGQLLGVVATGTTSGPGHRYYYASDYTNGSNGLGPSGRLWWRRKQPEPKGKTTPEESAAASPEDA
jgi:capsular exopolysaccharide synthesis family protein